MTETKPPNEVQAVITEIRKCEKSYYYIALQMHRHTKQIIRMHNSGRCQPHELDMLKEILADVSRETSDEMTPSETHNTVIAP